MKMSEPACPVERLQPEDPDPLVSRAQQGDAGAWDALVRRHYPAVYRLAVRMMRHAQDAEDAAQEAFFKAHRYLATYRRDSRFPTWLFTLARNVIVDHLRRRARKAPTPFSAAGPGGAPAEAPLTSERIAESREAVEERIAKLDEDDRWVILLVFMEGLSPKEASAVMGVSMNAVRIRLFRALRRLRGQEGVADV